MIQLTNFYSQGSFTISYSSIIIGGAGGGGPGEHKTVREKPPWNLHEI